MKKTGKRLTGFLLAFAFLAAMLFSVPVMAAESEPSYTPEEMSEQVESFVAALLGYTDEELQEVVDYYGSNGFYQIAADAIRDNREELGAYHQINEVTSEYSSSDEQWNCTVKASFDNYDAEIVLTLDGTTTSPTNFVINVDYPLGVKMAQAGQNTLIGILVVFVMLLFLAAVISLFKFVNPDYRKEKKKARLGAEAPKDAPAPKAAAPAPKAAPAAAPAPAAASNDAEVIAVIAAAIAAAEADSTLRGDSYVVTSIKRVGTSRRWKRA